MHQTIRYLAKQALSLVCNQGDKIEPGLGIIITLQAYRAPVVDSSILSRHGLRRAQAKYHYIYFYGEVKQETRISWVKLCALCVSAVKGLYKSSAIR